MFYAEKLADGFSRIIRTTPGTQMHMAKPIPVAWGYYPTKREAKTAVKTDDYASYYR